MMQSKHLKTRMTASLLTWEVNTSNLSSWCLSDSQGIRKPSIWLRSMRETWHLFWCKRKST